jgi:uncharacterized integral membrane protein
MTEPGEDQPTSLPEGDQARWRARRKRGGDTVTLVWGVILLAVGIWFFLDNTLGIEMPRIQWADVWPVIVIAVGVFVILQGLRRRTS